MTAKPRSVLDAAARIDVPADAEAVVLFEERRVVYAASGATERTYRNVYQVRSEAAAQQWGQIQAGWEPWHENKPSLKARVIAADGRAFLLDPKTVETTTPRSEDGDLYTDRSLLRAPLPGIGRGAIVELEITSQETAPLFDQGVVERFLFVVEVPTQKVRLVLDAPESLPIKLALTNGTGIERTETRAAGRVVTRFEGGPLAAREPLFANSPPELYQSSFVTYTTGQSWQRVAGRYAKVVDDQLRGADVRAWERETVRGRKGRDATAAAIVARVRKEIRYTGVEFGDASIVPRPPAEVFARRFGDCKDQAALVVALLREAGIEAYVALIEPGLGHDVDPALPGFGFFSHAIVYLPGRGASGSDLWIDPTARFTPVGELPLADQGRLALIARPGTTKLVKTPVAPASVNLTREEREITLSEEGKIALKERTTYAGTPAASARASFGSRERRDLEEQLTSYLAREYKAKKMADLSFPDPADLEHPFSLTLTAEGADFGYVGGESADLPLRVLPLFRDLPDALRDPDEAEKTLPAQLKGKKRTADFVYPMPFVYELVYRIVPAHGFAVQSLPAPETWTFGSARLQLACTSAKDGSVEARYRFESGKNRLTVDEMTEFQQAFGTFGKSQVPTVRFALVAESELQAGRMKSALAAFRRLDQEHPNTAHHAAQLARALLLAGLGEAARREANRAATLDPKSIEAMIMLGTVLEHDLLGRPMKPGFDRAGAEAAFRKAIEIDAKDPRALRELALMAEYDDDGEHSWPAQRLEQAKALHERYQKMDNKGDGYDVNYLITLFRLGRYQEVIGKSQVLAKSVAEQGLVLAATALLKTPEEAIRQGSVLVADSENRPEAFRLAGAELLALRRYPESMVLFSEAARNHKQASALRLLVEMIRQTKRREALTFDERDPRQVVAAYLASVASDDGDPRRYLTPEELAPGFDVGGFKRGFRLGVRRAGQSAQIPLPVQFDMMISRQRLQEGDPRWGVWVRPAGSERRDAYFLVPRDGRFRLLPFGAELGPALGREAARRIEQRDFAGARYLLGKIEEDAAPATSDDPFTSSAFGLLWRYGNREDEGQLRLMALVAQGDPARHREILPMLEACDRGGASDAVRVACERTRIDALWGLGRKDEAKTLLAQLASRLPDSRAAQLRLAGMAIRDKEWDRANAIVERVLQAKPDDEDALLMQSEILTAKERLLDAIAVLRTALASAHKPDLVHNNIAWHMLYLPTLDPAALDHARQAVALTQRRDGASLHTLATVLAESGHPEEARQTLLELFEVEGLQAPRSIDWYVIGRIAEEYGEKGAALSAYRKVEPPKRPELLSTQQLAARRIRILEGKP